MPDGSVLKRYTTGNAEERIVQDRRSLVGIAERFREVHRHGWRYRVVRFLRTGDDERTFYMEFAPGQSVARTPRSQLRTAEFHCGIWLALYHNTMLDDMHEGLIFSDVGVHNLLVDPGQKVVTAIDPGMQWGRRGFSYEDLVQHLHSVFSVLVLRRRVAPSVILSCLDGYRRAIRAPFSPSAYYRGLSREIKRTIRAYGHQSLPKLAALLLVLAMLSGFYLFALPALLMRRH